VTIQVEGLTVNYGVSCALFDITFTIDPGKMVAIVGPNGAGKSTLLKAMAGLVKPTSGYAYFFNQPFKKVRERVAYVAQRSSIDWNFPITAFDVVLMGRYRKLGFFKWARHADKEAALSVLDLLGMKELKHRQISQLSGGQQQRLFLARALLQEAEVYLLDEPFAGVDLSTEKLLIEVMTKLKNEGKTLIVVHHDLNTVPDYFDEVILVSTSLVAAGAVQEVFTEDNILRTYGQKAALFADASKLSRNKAAGRP
jgi:manganese/zinc/iron transport system ATP- binding protein